MAAMAFWIFLVKFLKHLRHFLRYPADVIFLPAIVIFGYAHCFIKLYAMTTLHVVSQAFDIKIQTMLFANVIATDGLGK